MSTICNAAARPESLGVVPRRAATVQLTAGQKYSSGHINPKTTNRFWMVYSTSPEGREGVKRPHPDYSLFNQAIDWKDDRSVALRTTFRGVLRHAEPDEVADLANLNYRDPREGVNPSGNRFFCRCDCKVATRWDRSLNGGKGDYRTIELKGGKHCPCFLRGAALRTLRLWFQPVWPEEFSGLPIELILWVTKARRTIDSFFGVLADVERFAEGSRAPLNLIGMPFTLQFGKRKGEAEVDGKLVRTKYTDIQVSFRGDIAEWAGWQRRTIHQIGGNQIAVPAGTVGPGRALPEHTPEAISADDASISDRPVIRTRPAEVADVEVVEVEPEPEEHTEPPAEEPPETIGKEGLEKLEAHAKAMRKKAAPRVIPQAMSAIVVEAGVQLKERLPGDLTLDEGNQVWKHLSQAARMAPRKE